MAALTADMFERIYEVWPEECLVRVGECPYSTDILAVAARWAYGYPNAVAYFIKHRGKDAARMLLVMQGTIEGKILWTPEANQMRQMGANDAEILEANGIDLRLTSLQLPGEIPSEWMFPKDFPED